MAFRVLLGAVLACNIAISAHARTVGNDMGGNIMEYHRAVKRIEASGEPVRIDGLCASACTLYLRLPSKQLCITPRARFGFHASNQAWGTRAMWNEYPGWVRQWITTHGGLTKRQIVMPNEYAAKHISFCQN